MGALAPVTLWIPEDDLLLKNAVEAGASLESLAKGAVRFSRRYTTRELQDRWYALLYDPDTSAQACARMFELEFSTSSISSQSNRLGVSEVHRGPGKRKEESVRSHYYAMRKRICNEHFNNMDLSFFVAPNIHNCSGNRDGCQEQLGIHNEHPIGMLGDPIRNHFSLEDTGFDMMHHGFSLGVSLGVTPENSIGVGNPAHAFHAGDTNSLQGDIPNGIMGTDCLYGFVENVPPVSVNEAGESDMGHSFERDNAHKDIPHILGENLNAFESNSAVQEMGPSQAMPVSNLFETDDLKTKALSDFDPTNNHPGNICSEFGERQGFNSPVSDCRASFHQLGYSSPLPTEPIWRTIEDMSVPCIPIDENLGEKDKDPGDASALHDDAAKRISSCDYQVFQSEFFQPQLQLKGRVSDVELSSSNTIPEGDFVELPSSLLNFENEEVLFMDVDGKEVMDKSSVEGLNSILLSPPNEIHQDDISSISKPQASVMLDTYPDVSCSGEFDGLDEKLLSEVTVSNPEINLPSSKPLPNPHSPELRNGIICCTLNTEDPEIPSNDDVFLPVQAFSLTASSVMKHCTEEAGSSVTLSTKGFSDHQEGSEQGLVLVKEEQDPFIVSQMREPHVFPEMCSNNLTNGCGVKPELPENDSLGMPSSISGTVGGDHSKYSLSAGLKEDATKVEFWKHPDFDNSINFLTERRHHGCDHIKNHPQKIMDCCEHEENFPVADQNLLSRHSEHGSFEMAFPEPATNSITLDQEEQHSEDDDDVPYFSDIEAMILDMDLGPRKQESCFSREVSRYQYEQTKKAIIRLEQGAHSYMQRAIASHGAFAILYGRHLKHYIKKQEVLLGRATENDSVDIDLAREGRAHKISRQQARIKMEEDGSFYLTNLGKCSILVKSKELVKGHCVRLSSSCLIEIRSLRFIFETNETVIKWYMANNPKNNQDRSLKLEWSSEGVV